MRVQGPAESGHGGGLYGVAASCRGHGYATSALRQLTAIAWAHGAAAVLAEIEPANIASSRAVEKCGFRRRSLRTAEDGVSVVRWVTTREAAP